MDPFTIGLMMASTALSSGGKFMAGLSQSRADYAEGQMQLTQADLYGLNAETALTNVKVLTTQAEIAGMGADFAFAKARLQKGRILEKGRTTLAAQRAEYASRNIDPTFGSPLLTQALTAGRIAQDLDLTDANAEIEAADAKTRRANILGHAAGAQGQVVSSIGQQLTSTMKAKSLFTKSEDDVAAGAIGALSSILSGAASLGKGGSFGGGSTFQGNPWGAESVNVPSAGRDF
ncbi:hypothetical protein ASC80_01760 [Afipia sp. Root123D2]|uniref:hypothetical protein n=1 Tax=Afipia sp. Root123D2 TaxID=1736436 RepID=UPI0007018BAA|nr:hypothetical protein [Afipia sp. Root123D2]KQW22149.1 hypothetical protein ASC80_01760 [Afipia sp. Root123D2]